MTGAWRLPRAPDESLFRASRATMSLAAPPALCSGNGKTARPNRPASPIRRRRPRRPRRPTSRRRPTRPRPPRSRRRPTKRRPPRSRRRPTRPPKPQAGQASTVEPPHEEWDIKDVEEVDGKKYLFIGARYRGNIIPKFMLNLFVDEGATIYSNTIAVELDMRKDGFSLIPALGFTEYGTERHPLQGEGRQGHPRQLLVREQQHEGDLRHRRSALVGEDLEELRVRVRRRLRPRRRLRRPREQLGLPRRRERHARRRSNGTHYAKCQEVRRHAAAAATRPTTRTPTPRRSATTPSRAGSAAARSRSSSRGSRSRSSAFATSRSRTSSRASGLGFALTGFWFGLNGEYGLEQKPKP